MTNEEKLLYCRESGGMLCKEHFYNGHNDLGIPKCWCLDTAELVEREIYPSLESRATVKVKTLKCFRPQRNMNQKWVKKAGFA
jgi:hypothetical protein